MILCEHGPDGVPALFDGAAQVIVAQTAKGVPGALARLDAARAQGAWIAGYAAYELGYVLEPRLARLMPRRRAGPACGTRARPRRGCVPLKNMPCVAAAA